MLLVIKMKKLLLYIAIIFFAYSCGTKRVIYNNKKTEPEKEKKVFMSDLKKFGMPLPDVELPESATQPDWQQANPAEISRALDRALARPHGNWYVVEASRRIGKKPRKFRIAGRDMVAWRAARGPPIDRLSGVRSKGHTSAGGDLCGLFFRVTPHPWPCCDPVFLVLLDFYTLYRVSAGSRPARPPSPEAERETLTSFE